MATLQEHYNQINEGKGNKAQFLKQARELFPQHFNQYSDFNTVTNVLKSKQIISESKTNVVTKGFDIYDWKKILAEEVKAEEKTTSKGVIDIQKYAYDNVDMKNADNVNFNEIMKGFYAELKDPKNHDKTGDEIKAMVVKNLAKDCLHYTKDGMFGEKGLGFTTEAPGLGTPKEPKGKFRSSGYGDLDTEVKIKEPKSNTQDSLGDKEAKTSDPKKVKEMPTTPQNSAGVKKMKMPGDGKTMKLQEGIVNENEAVYDQIDNLENDLMLAQNDEHKAEIEKKIKALEAELLRESKLISLVRTMIRESLNEGSIKFTPGRVYASKNGKLTYIGVVPPGGSHKGQKNPTQENLYLFADENGKKGFGFTIEQLKQAKMDPMSTAGDFGDLSDFKANIVPVDKLGGLLNMINNATFNKTVPN